jgi:hypothetical protein
VPPIIILREYVLFVDKTVVPSAVDPRQCPEHITEHNHIVTGRDVFSPVYCLGGINDSVLKVKYIKIESVCWNYVTNGSPGL